MSRPSSHDEALAALELIQEIIGACPRREAGTDSERRAQEMAGRAAAALGLEQSWHRFRFNRSLYEANALHMALGVSATAISGLAPALALPMHLLAGASYIMDASRKGYLLRRLLPSIESQNLLLTSPAPSGAPRLRLVFIAHADAAPTGYMFSGAVLDSGANRSLPGALGYLTHPVIFATYSQFLLAGFDLLRCVAGPLTWPLRPLEWLLTLPTLGGLLLHLELLLRNEIVPGANDNLSGCAGLALLASRFAASTPDDVELVFVIAGAEEAGTGGSRALARDMRGEWDPTNTVVLGVDGLSGGELSYFVEGDILPLPLAPWLRQTVEDTAAADPRFAEVAPHHMDVGATDAGPFQAAGYDAVCIGRVDRALGSPRHYHHPTDTADNLDMDQVMDAVDYVEALVGEIIARRR